MSENAQPDRELNSSSQSIPAHSIPSQNSPIDVAALDEMLGPQETTEILQLFVTSTEGLLSKIGNALEVKDERVLREAAHELKGACASVGATSMAASCLELEQGAKTADWEKIPSAINALNRNFEFTKVFIENLHR